MYPADGRAAALGSVRRPPPAPAATGEVRRFPDLRLWRHTPRGLACGASNFDLPAQLHDPIRGNAEELGRIEGEVAQEDE